VGSLDAGFNEIIVDPVIVMKQQHILPVCLVKTKIEVAVGSYIYIVPMVSEPAVGDARHKFTGIIRGTIVTYNEFNIPIGLIQGAFQGLT
jgi:hypothetical protein